MEPECMHYETVDVVLSHFLNLYPPKMRNNFQILATLLIIDTRPHIPYQSWLKTHCIKIRILFKAEISYYKHKDSYCKNSNQRNDIYIKKTPAYFLAPDKRLPVQMDEMAVIAPKL